MKKNSQRESYLSPYLFQSRQKFKFRVSRKSTTAQEDAEKMAIKAREQKIKELETRKAESSELVVEALRREILEGIFHVYSSATRPGTYGAR